MASGSKSGDQRPLDGSDGEAQAIHEYAKQNPSLLASFQRLHKLFTRGNYRETGRALAEVNAEVVSSMLGDEMRELLALDRMTELHTFWKNSPMFMRGVQSQIGSNARLKVNSEGNARRHADTLITGVVDEWAKARVGQPGLPVVHLNRNFTQSLIETDIDRVATTALRIPFPGTFVIRFPEGMLQAYDEERGGTGAWVDLTEVGLTPIVDDFETNGRGTRYDVRVLHAYYIYAPDAQSSGSTDDYYQTKLLVMHAADDNDDQEVMTLDQLCRKAMNCGPWDAPTTPLRLVHDDGTTSMVDLNTAHQIVYGTLLYLNLPNPSLRKISNHKPVTLEELIENPGKTTKVKKGKRVPTPSAMISEEVEALPRAAYKHRVRGHWRNQPHGPGRTLRRLQWIKPFIRHKDGPGELITSAYEV
jgi:hypothetical protein